MNEREHSAGADKVEAIAPQTFAGRRRARAAGGRGARGGRRARLGRTGKAEGEADRAAHAAEEEAARRMHAAERKERRAERRQKRRENRTPGFGGWLAAVVSLSVAVLRAGRYPDRRVL